MKSGDLVVWREITPKLTLSSVPLSYSTFGVNMRCTIWGQIQRDPQSISSLILWLEGTLSDRTTPSALEIRSCIVQGASFFSPKILLSFVLDFTVLLRHARNK